MTGEKTASLYDVACSYIPEKVSEEELLGFIKTIDFSKFKNKMQGIGIVQKPFGTAVDGKVVSKLIQTLEI